MEVLGCIVDLYFKFHFHFETSNRLHGVTQESIYFHVLGSCGFPSSCMIWVVVSLPCQEKECTIRVWDITQAQNIALKSTHLGDIWYCNIA